MRRRHPGRPAAALPHEFEPDIEIALEPVDSVVVTTLMDNVTDIFMPDQGPARRPAVGRGPARPASVMEDGQAPDALVAEHGFSVLVTVAKAGREHRFLFDAGTSPDGVTENMRRLGIDPGSIEAIDPGVLVPAHCTGWRARHAMSARFPAAFVPNTVGTSFHLTAE